MRLIPTALAAFLAVSTVQAAPSRHPGEAFGPDCLTASAAMTAVAEHLDAVAGRLDGQDAQGILDRINAIGDPTDFHAQTIVVVLRPDKAVVAMFTPCHTTDVTVELRSFADIWTAARGTRV